MMKKILMGLFGAILLSGCATQPKSQYDYTALKQSKPKSILVVMPLNNSVDTKAEASVLARASYFLAEKGYYVYPVTLVDETFKQNGLTDGAAIQNANPKKIHEIFGADSILYLTVNEYGSSYKLLDSVTTVSLDGKLVDLRSGTTLWSGSGKHSQGSVDHSKSNLLGSLIVAAISQAVNASTDQGYKVSAVAMSNLVENGTNGGLLIGPRHPKYGMPEKK